MFCLWAGCAVYWFWGAAIIRGEESAPPPPVLHEYLPEISADQPLDERFYGVEGDSTELPEAIVYDGEILLAPSGGPLRTGEQVLWGLPGSEPRSRPLPRFRPDRRTELVEPGSYDSVFTPTIAPYKRVVGLDAVVLGRDGVTPVLELQSAETAVPPALGDDTSLRRGGTQTDRQAQNNPSLRDHFWGSVVVDFESGQTAALPSVSPDSRVISFEVDPPSPVELRRDGAGNFYAVAGADGVGLVRIVYLMDAPQSYFNHPIPEIPADTHADRIAELPASIKRRALRFSGELGLSRGDGLRRTLEVLTGYFRSFEETDASSGNSGDIYLDLARGKMGVCRHRAYAFMVTSMALGIPTRFVHNEVHAWVEVYLSNELGWMRIGLGGATSTSGRPRRSDAPRYRARFSDPLPQPESYLRSLRIAGLIGRDDPRLTREEREMRSEAASAADLVSGESNGVLDSGHGSQVGYGSQVDTGAQEQRQALILELDRDEYDVFRGRTLQIDGRARDSRGAGLAGFRIEVLVRGPEERLLGVTVSREHGWFRAAFGVPSDLPVGLYRLLVRSPGNERFAPATARASSSEHLR